MIVDWRTFLMLSMRHLTATHRVEMVSGSGGVPKASSWCSFTTFRRLESDAGYWTFPLPTEAELMDTHTTDGGTWGQPFSFDEFAHFLIPRNFTEETIAPGTYRLWAHQQDIDGLSRVLGEAEIDHHLSKVALEIKLF